MLSAWYSSQPWIARRLGYLIYPALYHGLARGFGDALGGSLGCRFCSRDRKDPDVGSVVPGGFLDRISSDRLSADQTKCRAQDPHQRPAASAGRLVRCFPPRVLLVHGRL